MGLYKELSGYKDKKIYPMHMPGHKRNAEWKMDNPYEYDITEIDGFDNLGRPQGIINDCMRRAAAVYGSSESYLLVNGATAGILAAVSAVTKQGDTVLIMRNSHIAVYNAAYINKLRVQYLYTKEISGIGILGGASKELVEEGLREYPETSLVVITSPTYDGIMSDIKEIAKAVHRHKIPLLVDASHGAHLGFHPYFYENAADKADLVIHGIHKTLPAFTQTALMHVNGDYVSRREIKKYLSIYQTTSPSYILMAGIERCITFLENHSKNEFTIFAKRLEDFYSFARKLNNICVYQPSDNEGIKKDPSKLIIYSKDRRLTGPVLYEELINKYHIQPEMAGGGYCLCLTSVCDTLEGFSLLKEALASMDGESIKGIFSERPVDYSLIKNVREYHYYEIDGKINRRVKLNQSGGCISAEFIYLYPPGIPIIVPGELISEDAVCRIEKLKAAGLSISGMEDPSAEHIRVLY